MAKIVSVLLVTPLVLGLQMPATTRPTRWTARMSASPSPSESSASRRDILAAGTAGLSALLAGPTVASAAKYGDFGVGSPEVLNPADGIVDTEILKSASVQAALKEVQGYLDSVKKIEEALAKDDQLAVIPLLTVFEFNKIRSNLNEINTCLDEDTQRGTDRLIRATLQDLTELAEASKLKAGVKRSERKIEIMKKKLNKLDSAFTDFLKFFK